MCGIDYGLTEMRGSPAFLNNSTLHIEQVTVYTNFDKILMCREGYQPYTSLCGKNCFQKYFKSLVRFFEMRSLIREGGEKVAGSKDEFEEIYIRNFNDVFLFLKKLSKDESIAEEITSQTFFNQWFFRGRVNTSPPLTSCPFHVMLLKRRQPDASAAVSNKHYPILNHNGLYTEFGIDLQKTLDSFDFSFQPSIDKRQIDEPATIRFLENGENVVLLRPPRWASPIWPLLWVL